MAGMFTAAARIIRLRYSLRCLFVALTLCALWIGWQTNIVRQRQALLRLVRDAGGVVADEYPVQTGGTACAAPPSASLFRGLIGDQAVGTIGVPDSLTDEYDRIARAFPEAAVLPLMSEIPFNTPSSFGSLPGSNYSLDTFVERPSGR